MDVWRERVHRVEAEMVKALSSKTGAGDWHLMICGVEEGSGVWSGVSVQG